MVIFRSIDLGGVLDTSAAVFTSVGVAGMISMGVGVASSVRH